MSFGSIEGAAIRLDRSSLEELARVLARKGVGAMPTARLLLATAAMPIDDAAFVAALRATLEAVDASSEPEGEWQPARELLGDELLSALVQASVSALRRYASRERRTPDEVAWHLHVVARLLASLVGSYNHYGVRRWFRRPRARLDGATPAEVLERAVHEDEERLGRVLALAEEVTGAAGAT